MKTSPFVLLLSLLIVFAFGSGCGEYIVIPIADYAYPDDTPSVMPPPVQIDDNGYVVWHAWDGSDMEIYLYDGISTRQLTNNDYDDAVPRINNRGQVVWEKCDFPDYYTYPRRERDIFLYDGTGTTIQLGYGWEPQINNDGYVVWEGCDGADCWSGDGIFLYDGTSTTQLTNNSGDNSPQINDDGYVVWRRWSVFLDEVFLYDGTSTTKLTNGDYTENWRPQINNNGQVVWVGSTGTDGEIFFYDGTSTTQLTDNYYSDDNPQINDNGYVVWEGDPSGMYSYEIFLYDGTSTTQLTNNDYEERSPQINDKGYVAWWRNDYQDVDVWLYNGKRKIQLSKHGNGIGHTRWWDGNPQINDKGDVVWEGPNPLNSTKSRIFLAINIREYLRNLRM